MKTNLIFKRQETVNGITKVVTKIVPVDVPHINSGEGWILYGHTDIVEVMTDKVELEEGQSDETVLSTDVTEEKQVIEEPAAKSTTETTNSTFETKFISDVAGTAKLVRSRGVVKIVARRGKATYNQTTPNSVCIDDVTKNHFFKDCLAANGNNGCYSLSRANGSYYDYWNDVIDKEYIRQKKKATSTTK